jgi:hypothetical protein
VTREGLSDLTLVGNRAQAIGLELPAATLKASSAQLTQLIRQTCVVSRPVRCARALVTLIHM